MSTILPAMQKLLLDRGWNATTTPIVLGRYPAVPDTVLALRELVDIPGKDFGGDNLPLLGLYELHMTIRVGKDVGTAAALNLAWDAYRRLAGRHITVTVGVAPNAAVVPLLVDTTNGAAATGELRRQRPTRGRCAIHAATRRITGGSVWQSVASW
jgi:hypothetical protein